jgi:hypothetical protein
MTRTFDTVDTGNPRVVASVRSARKEPRHRPSLVEQPRIATRRREAELMMFRRWVEFHREALGFNPSWESCAC